MRDNIQKTKKVTGGKKMPEKWEEEMDFDDEEKDEEVLDDEDEFGEKRELAIADDEEDGFEDEW